MSKISVCIPSYNHEKYIYHTIESVLNQSFQDFEIIISDDNSSDNTLEIAKSFKDSRIKIIENKKNNGTSINTNIAIENSCGEFIALIASDDMMHQDRLKKTFEFLSLNKDVDAVFTWVKAINENNLEIDHQMTKIFNVSFTNEIDMLRNFFYTGNYLCAPSCLIKKDALLSCGHFNPFLLQLQDFELWIKMLINGHKIKILEEKLTYYRISDSNLSSITSQNSKFFSRILFETEKVLEVFLTIKDTNLMINIFPELKKTFTEIKAEYKDLYIAKLALVKSFENNIVSLAYKNFVMNTIYKNVHDKFNNNQILEELNFSTREFFELSSSNYLVACNLNNTHVEKNVEKKSIFRKMQNSISKRINKIKKTCS